MPPAWALEEPLVAIPLELAYDRPELWGEDIPVAVAPDGTLVAYVVRHMPADVDIATEGGRWAKTGRPTSATGTQIHVSHAETGLMRQACENGGYSWRPSWSPDSNALAFYSDAGGTVGLWVYDVQADRCRKVGDVVIKAKLWVGDEPQWSPDSKTVYVPLLPEGRTPGYEAAGTEVPAATGDHGLVLYTSGLEVPLVNREGRGRKEEGSTADDEHYIRENSAAIGAIDIDSGASQVLLGAATEPRPSVMRVSASGRWISFLSIWQRESGVSDTTTLTLGAVRSDGGQVQVVAEGLPITHRDYHRLNYAWHPSADSLVYLKDGALYRVDFDGDGPQAERQLGAELGELSPGVHWFTRDGGAVVVGVASDRVRASALGDAPPTGLALVPFEGGTPQRMTFDFASWAYEGLIKADPRTVWQPDGRSLSVRLRDMQTGEVVVARINPADGTKRELWRGRARIRGLTAAADGRELFGSYEDVGTPADVYRFPSSFADRQRLSHIAPGLDVVKPPRVEVFTTRVPMHDHSFLDVRTAVLLPADAVPGQPPPGIVTFYPDLDVSTEVDKFGGGNRAGVPAVVFVSRGYAVIYPHVKTGPGDEPGSVINEMIDSMMPQIYRAVERGYIDPARLALQGNSFGGYGTAAIVTRTNLFRAAVPTNGIYDLVGYAYSGAPAGNVAWSEARQPRLGTHLWAAPLRYIENSPLFAVDKINTPLLIMQGGNDPLRPEAEKLFTALKRLDKPAQLAIYDKSGHWIAAWPRQQAIAATLRILNFYEEHLSADD